MNEEKIEEPIREHEKIEEPEVELLTPKKEEKKEPSVEEQVKSLTTIQKIAIMLTVLGEDVAAIVLEHLDKKLAEEIVWEISKQRIISKELSTAVMKEFLDFYKQIKGGRIYALRLLKKAFGAVEAEKMLSKEGEAQIQPLSELLKQKEPDEIADIIRDEHPQVISIVMSMLPPDKAANVLKHFPIELRIDVIKRLATRKPVASAAIGVAEKYLRERIKGPAGEIAVSEEEERKGIKIAADILSKSDMDSRKEILQSLKETSSEIASAIRREMFTFEDIMRLDKRTLQLIIPQLDIKDIALALKGADEALKNKFLENMSERLQESLLEEMELMGPVRISEVDEAQRKITDLILRLEEEGKITLPGRGEVIIE